MLGEHEERLLGAAIYEGLVCYDEEKREMKPLLAKSWDYSQDGRILTIKLKRDIKFHNGKKLTAAYVKSAWEHSLSSCKDWTNTGLFLSIAGTRERLEGQSPEIYGIRVINDHTLKIGFQHPNTSFIYTLANPMFWVYDCQTDPVNLSGTGPFILKNNQNNRQFTLLRNEEYHRGKPPLSAIKFEIYEDMTRAAEDFKAGKLDYLDQAPMEEIKELRQSKGTDCKLIQKPVLETYSLGFNLNRQPFLNNYLLRRALNYAIDRKTIAEKVLGENGIPLNRVLLPGINGYDRHVRGYSFSPEKARQLMDEAGYPDGKGLPPLVIGYDQDEGHQAVLEMLAEQLEQIGVRVQLQPMDWDYYKKEIGKMEMSCFRVGWQADYPEADAFLYSLYHSSRLGISNYYAYNNPQLDKILDQSRCEPADSEKRAALLKRAEKIIIDDAPCLWLFQKKAAKLTGPGVECLEIDKLELIDWSKVELHNPSLDENHEGKSLPQV